MRNVAVVVSDLLGHGLEHDLVDHLVLRDAVRLPPTQYQIHIQCLRIARFTRGFEGCDGGIVLPIYLGLCGDLCLDEGGADVGRADCESSIRGHGVTQGQTWKDECYRHPCC